MLRLEVGSNLRFSPVTIQQKLLLVVQQLLSSFGGEFLVLCFFTCQRTSYFTLSKQHTFDNGINGARFLAETTVDALCHINVFLKSEHTSLCSGNAKRDVPYRVVLLDPSSRASDSIVIACAGQIASHNLHAASSLVPYYKIDV